MKTTVTITSKRQLTIPKELWQRLNLEGIRYLEAEVENGSLKLHKVSFDEQLGGFWRKTAELVKGPLDDESIRRASHAAHRSRMLI